ncbi:MAG: tRNA 2-thiouridine(34) synthase MnmA [Alphaproteobacteria bacterium]|nr:tRNA 2-thiouridine(34) synthase MnmA [Alphaproteobacteria bacterium]
MSTIVLAKTKKVIVAMSGGVDSTVSAWLLLQKGYDVVGCFFSVWAPSFLPCTTSEERIDAMRACAQLGVPFIEIDATEAYTRMVIDSCIAMYQKGETPNPDILCNSKIKFGFALEMLLQKFPDMSHIATGHYARISKEGFLQEAVDIKKDQTYFLYKVPQSILSKVLFPIGGYKKDIVRSIAKKAGLSAGSKKDSTGVCFLGDVSIENFLKHYIPLLKGEVRHIDTNDVVGEHNGVQIYTLGQRHGFVINKNNGKHWFVLKKDIVTNTLWVGDTITNTNEATEIFIKDICILAPHVLKTNGEYLARFRHGEEKIKIIFKEDRIITKEKIIIAEGQSVVWYTKDGTCVGGGVVKKNIHFSKGV